MPTIFKSIVMILFWILRFGIIFAGLMMLLFCGFAGLNARYQFVEITIGFSGLDVFKLMPPAFVLSLILTPFFVWLDYRLLHRRQRRNQITNH